MKNLFRRIVSIVLSGCLCLTTLVSFPIFANEETEEYPYMMFASNTKENSIFLNATNITTNGKLCTNGTIYANATNCNLNGDSIENASTEMIYIGNGLSEDYFSFENPEIVDSYELDQTNIKIDNSIQAESDINLNGTNIKIKNSFTAGGNIDINSTNINIDSSIMAQGDISLNGTCLNNDGVVIYSQAGDITINTTNASFDSLIYAPYGNVTIDATNSNINGIIIADSITITGTNINVNYRQSIAEIVSSTPQDNDFTNIPSDATIELSASNEDIIIGEDSNQIYFYADFYYETEKLELVNAEDDSIVGTLYDDGNYWTHGDDLQGDGIYSCFYTIDVSDMKKSVKNNDFYVQYVDENGSAIKSNTLMIALYRDFTEKELLEVDAVDNIIFDWMNTLEYDSMSLEQRKENAYEILLELATNGTSEFPYSLVDINSIYYSESDYTYQYDYICGISSGITLISYNTDEDGNNFSDTESSNIDFPSFFYNSTNLINSDIYKELQIQEIDAVYQINNNVLILNSFETERESFYNELSDRLTNNLNLNVTLNSEGIITRL